MLLVINEDAGLAAVWLLATLNGDGEKAQIKFRSLNNYSKRNLNNNIKNKKSIEKIDIVKTCNSIINVSNKVSLRSTSNLMFGTVLAYKNKCIQNWKDVNSCRILIQRLNKVIQSNDRKSSKTIMNNIEDDQSKKSKIHLFKDDPNFDISQGLITDYEGIENNNNKNNNNSIDADWTLNFGFEVEKEEEEEDEDEEKKLKDNKRNVSGKLEEDEVLTNTQNEKWGDLEFEFDENGDFINNEVAKFASEDEKDEDIQKSLMEGFIDNDDYHVGGEELYANAFENDFNNIDHLNETVQPTEDVIKESVIAENEVEGEKINGITRKRKADIQNKRTSKRLIVDNDVCFSVSFIKNIRDGYLLHEQNQRIKIFGGIKYSIQSMMIEKFSDLDKYYRGNFSNLRGDLKIANENFGKDVFQQEQEHPNFEGYEEYLDDAGNQLEVGKFEDLEIEIGRQRQHSRSSSISSIEEARRVNNDNRHSSSFHFDFNDNDNNENTDKYDENMDMALLDISIDDFQNKRSFFEKDIYANSEEAEEGEEGEEDEGKEGEIRMAYVEKFYKEITNKDSRIILFSELASPEKCTKREASMKFMNVLQLTTWNRINVYQSGARSDIEISVI